MAAGAVWRKPGGCVRVGFNGVKHSLVSYT